MDIVICKRILTGAVAIGCAALLGACVARSYPPPAPRYALTAAPSSAACLSCGVITSIQGGPPGAYRIAIRMDDGSTRVIDETQQPGFQVGDRVQILTRNPPPPPAY